MGFTLLVLMFAMVQCFGLESEENWQKSKPGSIQGRYTSSFADNEKNAREKFGLTERTSFQQRIGRRRTSSRCFITGSTVHCDGGLKFRGIGPAGRPGSPGLPGPKGDKGYRGSPGRPGPDGPVGKRGKRGPKGMKGARGNKGDKGDRGRNGPQGPPGVPSNCHVIPPKTYNCPRGESGLTGIKGSQGPEGDVGKKGEPGFRGENGDKGGRGVPGIPGSIGLYGALRLSGSCRQLHSQWVIPNLSPIGRLKTECVFREYLLSLKIESDKENEKIRYNYKCCPFKASSAGIL